jgi:queuine tRNA-ribosyltransferase
VKIKNARYREDVRPVEEDCPCPACRQFTRAYLRHLFVSKEILSSVLNTLHNLSFYLRLLADMRAAIAAGALEAFCKAFLEDRESGVA